MKSKLFLEEGEISRILNMHKKAIQEQINVNGDEVETNQVQMDEELEEDMELRTDLIKDMKTYTLPSDYSLESSRFATTEGVGMAELKMFKGATFKIDSKGVLKSKTKYQFVDTVDGTVYMPGEDYEANYKVAVDGNGTITGTVTYMCEQGKFYSNYDVSKLFYDEDGKLVPKLNQLCKTSRTQTSVNTGGGGNVKTQSKCPKIEKFFKDNGYVMITQKRYQELANDKTRVRKYKWCPISKTNLYFAKVVGGGNAGGGGSGKIGGGGSLPFEYNEVMTAINTKCPATAGGGSSKGTGIDVDLDSQKEIPTPKMPTEVYNGL